MNLNNSKILVTGGVGFIGSHLCEALCLARAHVIAYDSFDSFYSRALKEKNAEIIREAGTIIVEGDIRDSRSVADCLRTHKIDTIVHLAARAGVRPSLENPRLYADVNVNGTTVLLEAARKARINKFIFASSSSVYGAHDSASFRESDRTDHPLSPYGATKKSGEAICHAFHHLYGLTVACLRFFTVYGPRQRPDLAIRKFVQLALNDQPIPVFGDGASSRDYTHVQDILTGIIGAIHWCSSSVPRYDIFNLGSSHPVVLKDMIDLIEATVGKPLKRDFLPVQPGDVPRTFADCAKAESELGFRQTMPFAEGIRDFVDWMKSESVS